MAENQPLRITCASCPGGRACDDCLIGFFVRERDAPVVHFDFDAPPAAPPPPPAGGVVAKLDPDLAVVLRALADGGLGPTVVAVARNAVPRAS